MCVLIATIKLLIVPYGIETGRQFGSEQLADLLLIVPYGIETKEGVLEDNIYSSLLIVPYGIETQKIIVRKFRTLPFNRTLWN